MSCTFAHNTNLSLISWLPESLETELSAFHQENFFFFFSFYLRGLSLMKNIKSLHILRDKEYSDICVRFGYQALQMEAIGTMPLLWLGDRLLCKVPQTLIFSANHL